MRNLNKVAGVKPEIVNFVLLIFTRPGKYFVIFPHARAQILVNLFSHMKHARLYQTGFVLCDGSHFKWIVVVLINDVLTFSGAGGSPTKTIQC